MQKSNPRVPKVTVQYSKKAHNLRQLQVCERFEKEIMLKSKTVITY